MGNHNVIFYPSNNPPTPSGSGAVIESFTATAGQTVFNTSTTLTANISVRVQGIEYAPSTYSYVVGGTAVTLNTPLSGGEYVSIEIL